MNKKMPYWKNSNYWVCPNHLPGAILPAELSQCWYNRCDSVRPKKDPKIVYLSDLRELCEWEKCSQGINGSRAKKLPGRKYCSHKCRKDKARWTYRLKKKKEKETA